MKYVPKEKRSFLAIDRALKRGLRLHPKLTRNKLTEREIERELKAAYQMEKYAVK